MRTSLYNNKQKERLLEIESRFLVNILFLTCRIHWASCDSAMRGSTAPLGSRREPSAPCATAYANISYTNGGGSPGRRYLYVREQLCSTSRKTWIRRKRFSNPKATYTSRCHKVIKQHAAVVAGGGNVKRKSTAANELERVSP